MVDMRRRGRKSTPIPEKIKDEDRLAIARVNVMIKEGRVQLQAWRGSRARGRPSVQFDDYYGAINEPIVESPRFETGGTANSTCRHCGEPMESHRGDFCTRVCRHRMGSNED